MPCMDGGPTAYDELQEAHKLYGNLEAYLCGILSAMTKNQQTQILARVDWKGAGVTEKQFRKWWKEHKAKDEARADREAFELAANRLRKKTLAKLTDKEKEAIGVRGFTHEVTAANPIEALDKLHHRGGVIKSDTFEKFFFNQWLPA